MSHRNDWMAGKKGIMIHFLPGPEPGGGSLDEAVNGFQCGPFLDMLDEVQADYLIFTLGQNTGWYNSPNSVMERCAGPGHCPRRDLALELAEGMHRRKKRFIAYLPCEVHFNPTLQNGFGWKSCADLQTEQSFRQELFQSRWCELVLEWAMRFGKSLDGWFFDGAFMLQMTHDDRERFRNAIRSGNPESVICFNPASYDFGLAKGFVADNDYFGGEATFLANGLPLLAWRRLENTDNPQWFAAPGMKFEENSLFRPTGAFLPGTEMRQHVLCCIDAFWYHNGPIEWLRDVPYNRYRDPSLLKPGELEPPIYSDEELLTLLNAFLPIGGTVTFNVAVRPDGSIGEATHEQLKRLAKHC